MRKARTALTFCALLVTGCGVALSHTTPFALSVPPRDPASFERLATLFRSRGYQVLHAEPTTGSFVVSAQAHARPSETIVFTVQIFQNGYAEIVPSGPRVARRGDQIEMPSAIVSEYRDLAASLHQELHRAEGAR